MWWIIIIVILVLLVLYVIGAYNGLVMAMGTNRCSIEKKSRSNS